MVQPKEIRFKAMSCDEKVIVLEQLTQEVLRAREERIASKSSEAVEDPQEATETIEISQVTSVQDGSPLEVQDMWERGLLMYQ